MCELLVRLRDKPLTGDAAADHGRLRRGDVVVSCPDGWGWTAEELTHERWAVLRVPGMTAAEGDSFTAPEPRDPYRRYFHPRLFALDLVRLDLSLAEQSAELVRAARIRKPPLPDLDVIGSLAPHPDVIGG